MEVLTNYRLAFEHYIVSGGEILDYSEIIGDYFDIVDKYMSLRCKELMEKILGTDPISKKQAQIEIVKILKILHNYFLTEVLFNRKYLIKIRNMNNICEK